MLLKQWMIDNGLAIAYVLSSAAERSSQIHSQIHKERSSHPRTSRVCRYSEPENTVMSRSGAECVVALTDQWCAHATHPPHAPHQGLGDLNQGEGGQRGGDSKGGFKGGI